MIERFVKEALSADCWDDVLAELSKEGVRSENFKTRQTINSLIGKLVPSNVQR